MSKHTKGPWTVTKWYGCFFVETDDSAVSFEVKGLNMEGDQANARLIAAAPELLEACEAFVLAVRAGSKQEIMLAIDAADKKARAAIAKAKGVENETAT